MNKFILTALLLAPGLAMASQPCALERTEAIELDAAGIDVLQVSIGPDSLRLDGQEGDTGTLSVRMCASDQQRLDDLAAALQREDDRLVLALDHGGRHNVISGSWFFKRSDYGRFEITGTLPARLAVDLTVGSGDAVVTNVAALEAVVGSGDLDVERVPGAFRALVGSGEIKAERTGPAEIGSIGSGSIDLRSVEGPVSIGAIGSGTASLRDVTGDVQVRTLGSGTLEARDIRGGLELRSKGSGTVEHRDVQGEVRLPRR